MYTFLGSYLEAGVIDSLIFILLDSKMIHSIHLLIHFNITNHGLLFIQQNVSVSVATGELLDEKSSVSRIELLC